MTNLSGANLNKREATGPKSEGRDIPSTFPQYPEYKDSGIEWLGEVPVLWEVVKLKRLCHMQSGDFISPSDIEEDGEYPVYGGNGHRGFTPSYTHNGLYPLVGRQGALCGNVNYAKGKFWASEHAVVASPDDDVSPVWLGELLRAMDLNQYSITAAQPGLAVEKIKNLFTPKPPLSEQSQIAAFLGHETARIDALVEEQQRLIALLKEKRQAVISHAVTKGLDPDVPMKDSGVEWLGEVPEHWAVGPLRWYATIQGGIAKGKSYDAETPTVELPYLRVANVQDGYVDLSTVKTVEVAVSEVDRYRLQEGDVLMNEGGDNDKLGRGTVWKGEITDCLHQNHVFAIRPNHYLLPQWLSMFTRSNTARAYFYLYSKQSTNLASISSSSVMSCPLPLPPVQEQRQVLDFLAIEAARLDDLMQESIETINLLQERRSALISAAVTGKIDVRGWQPPEDSVLTGEASRMEVV
ncbi:restriction endonuclease subunit S [Halomonas qaidamensis]|uniref:Restriction endonuclease subunit S n=1 Tax=Halomonas qaidamensis TaxID=2866211 RepID=A0ABY6JUI6_9GAMM|nr:restriction endonuclease subunit S [Halomonas qaidamensis]UYV20605.1 restriction endonuclease subunit S [Halomonas qaidamensis]